MMFYSTPINISNYKTAQLCKWEIILACESCPSHTCSNKTGLETQFNLYYGNHNWI